MLTPFLTIPSLPRLLSHKLQPRPVHFDPTRTAHNPIRIMLHKLISLSLPLLLLGIFPTALAKIENIVFPTTATAGQTIQAQVSNYNFIQNFDDFDIIFSLRVRVVWVIGLATLTTCASSRPHDLLHSP